MDSTPSNFEFLKEHDPLFFQLASRAEVYFSQDPNASLLKLRQLGEAMTRSLASRIGVSRHDREEQYSFFNRVANRLDLDRTISDMFHAIRKEGNDANHEFTTNHKQAMEALRNARHIAIWYHRSFGKQGESFKPGPFILPSDPSEGLNKLKLEIEHLKGILIDTNVSLEQSTELAALKKREAEEFAVLAQQMDAERKDYEQLYYAQEQELEQSKQAFDEKNADLVKAHEELKKENEALKQIKKTTRKAASKLHLSEAETRVQIDRQLRQYGWEADTVNLSHKNGARPEKGKNKAIAEWPTVGRQSADYVLFMGLTPLAVVEAKKENTDVAAKLPQAERYASNFKMQETMCPAWEIEGRTIAWPKGEQEHYVIPFVYSCNGRPYVKQYQEKSGIWYRDIRSDANLGKALEQFHTPTGLKDRLMRSKTEAEAKLHAEGFSYLGVRDYQKKAIQAVEKALEETKPQALLAMATGTGKTRTIIGLIYRFLKTERFKRILFLVDRSALGDQAQNAFKEAQLEQNQSLWTAYNVAILDDKEPEEETRIHVATVQAMVKRVFHSENAPSIDTYDCIIVDEAHRGYTLDQEMTDGELEIRDPAQYLSSYRRVLDYFEAFKVGMTATPAIHTTEIFGHPVYTYSYREAVADDWLIDHEPPYTYQTELNQNGIHIEQGETVSVVNASTGEVALAEMEDELDFNVEAFNRQVITPGFNKVIAEAFAQEFDPNGDEKAMVFCVKQTHAELFKGCLDSAFKEIHGDDYRQESVQIITGQTDQVAKAISRYKNERYPSVAITVDLLTTGIDVPRISHLLFIRRVRSRILYEQMIGRATRRCDEIGKTEFYIHDAVGIYEALEEVTTMRPLVKDPNVTIEQLIEELQDPASLDAPGAERRVDSADGGEETVSENGSHAHDVLDQLSQKLMRVLRKANNRAEDNVPLREKLDELEQVWGIEPAELHRHLHDIGPQQAKQFLDEHHNLVLQLEEVRELVGSDLHPVVYEGDDHLLEVTQGYGVAEKPADYLDSFSEFIRRQLNEHAAIKVVCTRPKDLTREQLKEIRLLLDANGFTVAKLKAAWRNETNQDIAASIIGHIRRAALGTALIPFERRVENAMDTIYSLHPWTKIQRSWLARLAKQLNHEVIIDQDFVNHAFASHGGVSKLDKQLGGELEHVMETLKETLWAS